MGIPERQTRGKQRTFLVVLFLLLQIGFLKADDNPAVDVLPDPVGMNDRFTISFVVNSPSASIVTVGDWDFPDGVRLYAGPYIRGIVETRENGSSFPAVSVSYILRSTGTGRILFPEIPYFVGSTRYETSPFIIRVGTYKDRQLVLPLEVEWEVPEGPFYEGQTIPAAVVVRNQEEIVLPERISVASSGGGFFEEAPELGEIRSRVYGGTTLYTVPVMGYLFTPTGSGRFFLNKATVVAEGVSGTSAAAALDVKPLPEAVGDSGAVGSFKLDTTLAPKEASAGDEISLIIRISGVGNLGYLTMPEPDFGGLTLLRSSEEYDYHPSWKGYEGFQERHYTLQAETQGQFGVKVPGFVYLDPENGKTIRIHEQHLAIDVSPGGVIAEGDARYKPETVLFSREELESAQAERLYRIPLIYLLFLPGPLLLLILRLRRRKLMRSSGLLIIPLLIFLTGFGGWSPLPDTVDNSFQAAAAGEYDKAAEIYRDLVSRFPLNGRLFFNLAVCLEETGDRSGAVTALFGAARRGVSDAHTGLLFKKINEEGMYVRQFSLPVFFNPDISFALLLVFYNLFFLTLILRLFQQPVNLLLASLLLATLGISAGGLFTHSLYMSRENRGVISEDVITHRIPRSTAQDWVVLPEGLAVTLEQRSDTFCLVGTAYGAEGWLDEASLMFERDLYSQKDAVAP